VCLGGGVPWGVLVVGKGDGCLRVMCGGVWGGALEGEKRQERAVRPYTVEYATTSDV